ncbi:MAG: sugar ABC transporter ATP-binding protein [Candidatus Humimicrobiaceae bacterium]
MKDTILKIKNITKIFPGVKALDNVSIEFKKGEIHGIVGENGAGKSTLIKILTGAITPTEGKIEVLGKEYQYFNPHQSLGIGICAIYQEFNLIPFLTVAENIFYGREVTKGPFLNRAYMNSQVKNLCNEMEVELNPKMQVKDLGIAYQQIVEIVKVLSMDAKILIMDEPTAPLTNKEIESLFKVIKKLKLKGVTIIYISHRLEEIFEICERVSIMRDSCLILTEDVNKISKKELISYMVGRQLGEDFPGSSRVFGEVVIEAVDLTTDKIKDVSFKLHKGEILGFGGLAGSGRTETVRAMFGVDNLKKGYIKIKGKKTKLHSPINAIKSGIGLIPEDRKRQGLILSMRVKENMTYAILDRISKIGLVKLGEENKICSFFINDLKIRTPSLNQMLRNLSGGNQQKVVLAKWLATECDILFFDEPTRGIDVGAKQEIYNLMYELTKKGKSIIMISSEMHELIGMSDRILVMHEGKITGELNKNEFSQQKILELASG